MRYPNRVNRIILRFLVSIPIKKSVNDDKKRVSFIKNAKTKRKFDKISFIFSSFEYKKIQRPHDEKNNASKSLGKRQFTYNGLKKYVKDM